MILLDIQELKNIDFYVVLGFNVGEMVYEVMALKVSWPQAMSGLRSVPYGPPSDGLEPEVWKFY